MQVQNHTIKKFSFELQTQGVQQSHALQKKCNRILNESMLLEMDKILSAYFFTDEIVSIKKIEIDLGNITTEDLEKDFAARCLENFRNVIKAITVKQKVPESEEVKIVTEAANYIQQFFYFLAEGRMLWSVQVVNFQGWQSAIITAAAASPKFFKTAFVKLLQQSNMSLERLLLQFDDIFLIGLATLFESGAENSSDYSLNEIQNAGRIKDIIAARGMAAKNAIAVILKNVPVTNDIVHAKTPVLEMPAAETAAETTINVKKIKAEEDNSIYIDNAGMIILHPFLQNIFNETGLIADNNFKNNGSKQKAVHLLQYLVNGQQETPEYIMPLNKILCGIPGEEHVERFVLMNEKEKQEAAVLLRSVLAHWKTLKNTSVEALQETFFQRKGKLTFNEANGYWKLQVERKAVDILLDRIPWGISYIQLPWMQYALVTEW